MSDTVNAQVSRLSRMRPGKHPIVSCYLKLEPRDRARGKYLIKLKNRIRGVEERLERLPATARVRVGEQLFGDDRANLGL